MGAVSSHVRVADLSNKMSSSLKERVSASFERATLGMGCFWGVESLYGATPGVLTTRVGFTGGRKIAPTYHSLDDHTEATEIHFDPTVISYAGILEIFWKNHNPTIKYKRQYMSAIFYHSDEQKAIAERTFAEAQTRIGGSKKIVTEILPSSEFYLAEDYHQKYYLQGHQDLLRMLKKLGMSDLVTSHVATRLNGYLGGQGSLGQFQSEDLGLSDEARAYVESVLKKGVHVACH